MDVRPSLMLRELQRAEIEGAAQLLGRAMRDNPIDARAFCKQNGERRRRALTRFFVPVLHGLHRRGRILGAFSESALVGVCGMARPGLCQPTVLEKLGVAPSVLFGNPLSTIPRVLTWTEEWSRRDLLEPHWHLGPVAVESRLQGQGIGTVMIDDFCARMDQLQTLSYLETDKFENIGFYQQFGFTVIAEAEVLRVPNWFMSRPPRKAESFVARNIGPSWMSRREPLSQDADR
jgi:ribosomal protein S18 acetylase RimI-like enzyme